MTNATKKASNEAHKAAIAAPKNAREAAPLTIADLGKIPAIQSDVSGTVLTLVFSDGRELVLDALSLSPEMQTQAMLHGLKQKLVDAAAIGRNSDTGKSATIADKYEAVREVFARITHESAATWNKEREAGAASGSGNSLLVRALMELKGATREAVEVFLSPKTKEQKTALRSNPLVAAIIARLQVAKGANIDTESLLDELS